MTTFDKSSIRAFRFVRCSFDAETGVARLVYAFDEGPELTETVTIPGAPFALDATRAQAVEQAVRLLHLITGVSYYKAAVPNEIRIDGYAIDASGARVAISTVAIPFLQNFSFLGNPAEHSYVDPSRPKSLLEQQAQ